MAPLSTLFDRTLLRRRLTRVEKFSSPFLLPLLAEELTDRLVTVKRRFARALVLSYPSDVSAHALAESGKVDHLIRADLLARGPDGALPPALVLDDERLPFAPRSFDLIVSVGTLQWANDLPGALAQSLRALKNDGLFLAALVGGESLTELRQAFLLAESARAGGVAPHVHPAIDVRDLGNLVQGVGFALPVVDRERLILRYDSPLQLVRELAHWGGGNLLLGRAGGLCSPRLLHAVCEAYESLARDADGRVRATLDLLFIAAFAPDPSQPKPLRPGSAEVSLAAVLRDHTKNMPET